MTLVAPPRMIVKRLTTTDSSRRVKAPSLPGIDRGISLFAICDIRLPLKHHQLLHLPAPVRAGAPQLHCALWFGLLPRFMVRAGLRQKNGPSHSSPARQEPREIDLVNFWDQDREIAEELTRGNF